MPNETLVHIVDDDEAVRDSLSFLLDAAGLPNRTYASAEELLATIGESRSGCVVTDVRMPGMSGIDLVRHLNETDPVLPVVVITGHGDVPLAVEAMKLGAMDFIEKPFDDAVLIAAVQSALAQRAGRDSQHAERVSAAERIAALSGRERDVLEGLVAGKPNKVIAYDLGISPRTVEVYRANLMTKMQASSLSDLVRLALLAGGLTSVSGRAGS